MTDQEYSFIKKETSLLFLQRKIYFSFNELKCPCCNRMRIHFPTFLLLLSARISAQMPFKINSAYRCVDYNKKIGSESDNHPQGKAYDISCFNSYSRIILIEHLLRAGFKRLGIHSDYIHADATDKPSLAWIGTGRKGEIYKFEIEKR